MKFNIDDIEVQVYTDSNGRITDYPTNLEKVELKLVREQKKLSRMVEGGSNYKKQEVKINKAKQKIANIKKDYWYKTNKKSS